VIIIVQLIHLIAQIITILVIVQVVLSYFMSPFHPIRQAVDRFVEPMLAPIRRVLPPMGMLDFSPLVLIILVQIIDSILTRLLFSL